MRRNVQRNGNADLLAAEAMEAVGGAMGTSRDFSGGIHAARLVEELARNFPKDWGR